MSSWRPRLPQPHVMQLRPLTFNLVEQGTVLHVSAITSTCLLGDTDFVWFSYLLHWILYLLFNIHLMWHLSQKKKKQSNSTAGVNKLKEDVHYQLQTFLLFEVFSISLSLHQHRWSHSWETIKVTQLEMINERSVTTTAPNTGFFRLFFFLSHCKDMFVYLCRFIIGSHIPPLKKNPFEYDGGNVSHHSSSLKARYMMFLVSTGMDN